MAGLKDIRSRIGSTKNTQKITSALKLVSASKLRRAQTNITNLRPYALGLRQLIFNLVASERASHDLLEKRDNPKNILLVVLASDRGLCGSFNSSINKFTEKYYHENKNTYDTIDFIFVGKKAEDYFRRRDIKGVDSVTDLAREISYGKAAVVAESVMESFLEGKYDEVQIIYNEFQSAISQEVRCEKLLPIDPAEYAEGDKDKYATKDMIIEPAPDEIVDQLLNKYFATQIYRCMSESVASEHGSRMTAMENATKNAGELIDTLTLTYNKLRQAKITTELTEITSGAEALNG